MCRSKKYQRNNSVKHTFSQDKMKWYVAKIVMQCKVDGKDSIPCTFDEQVRVIQAPDNKTAYLKSLKLGKEEEREYKNSEGKLVRWVFCGLSDLEEILDEKNEDGTEITSTLYESDQILELVRKKEDLTIFWAERNKDKMAKELLRE